MTNVKRIAIVRFTNYSENSNIIAENAHIEGTVRTFDPATQDKVEECIKHSAEEITRMYGGETTVEYQRMAEPVNNEERTAELVQQVAALAYLA